jgi:hypothetical protein
MRLTPSALRPVLAACTLVALTSCTDDQPTEPGLRPISAPASVVSAYNIVKVPAVTVDGNLSEWANIAAISLADDPNNGRGAANNSAKVKLAWDDTYLYAAYDVTDTELLAVQTTRDASDIYLDDAIELYIDPQGDGATAPNMTTTDYQFLANIRNAVGDKNGDGVGGKDAGFNAASFLSQAVTRGTVNATGTDTGYSLELRIAWTDLGVTPASGHFMRIDPAIEDRDGNPATNSVFDWGTFSGVYNNPSGWLDVQLVNPPPPVSKYDIVKVPAAGLTVDGNLIDWNGIASISLADSSRTGAANNTAKVKLAWNDTYLYAAYDITDTELLAVQTIRDASDIYLDDAIELYIDPQGDGASAPTMAATDYQFLANLRNAVGDKKGDGAGGKDPGFNAAGFLSQALARGTVNATGTDTGYSLELRIAWTDLGVTPAAGNFMRIDPAVDDRDGSPATTTTFDWGTFSGVYNNPSGWEWVGLTVDNSAPAAPTNPALTVVSSSQIDVSWTGSSSTDVSKYNIYRGTTGTPTLYQTVTAGPYHDTGLTPGTSYTYQIAAVDAAGNESPKTAASSATTIGNSGAAPAFTIFSLWNNNTLKTNSDPFNGSLDAYDPSNVIPRIQEARRTGTTLILALTGGNHSRYLVPCPTCTGNDSTFDPNKWKAVLNTFNTAPIKDSIAKAVADGVVLGYSMIDEPHHFSWGGYFTKPKIDELAQYAKSIFPTLPTGVGQGGQYEWRATERYATLDFVLYQYSQFRNGADVTAFRNNSLAQAAVDGVVPILGVNLLDGGTRITNCPTPQTGGQGTFGDGTTAGWTGNCRMTPAQVRAAADTILDPDASGHRAAGFSGWEYDGAMMADANFRSAFFDVRTMVDALPRRSFRRGS